MKDDLNQLNQLELEAQAIDAEMNNEQFAQPEITPQPSLNENYRPVILKFLNFATGLVNSKIQFTAQHFTEQANAAIADSMVKVADVEGLDLNATFGDPDSRFGAWAGLVIAAGLPAVSFYFALKEYQPKKKTEQPVSAAQPVDSSPKPEDLKDGFHG